MVPSLIPYKLSMMIKKGACAMHMFDPMSKTMCYERLVDRALIYLVAAYGGVVAIDTRLLDWSVSKWSQVACTYAICGFPHVTRENPPNDWIGDLGTANHNPTSTV